MILGLLDRIIFSCGVILFLQLPTFIDQYTHRLGGFQRAQNEQIESFQTIANNNFNGDMARLIASFRDSKMKSVRDTASSIENSVALASSVKKDLAVLETHNLTKKIVYLLGHLRYQLAQDTLQHFRPTIPLSLQSLLYGLLGGILASILFFVLIRFPVRLIKGRLSSSSQQRNLMASDY